MKEHKNNPAQDEQDEKLIGIFESVNKILSEINTQDITSESGDAFAQLPDGYYLGEVSTVTLTTSKSSGNPMVSWRFKTVENGVTINDSLHKSRISGSNGKSLFVHHVLNNESNVERFISDALKFEGEEEGVPYLAKEYFTTAEVINDALELLVGLRLWLHVDTDDNSNTWTRLVSWKRASKLELED